MRQTEIERERRRERVGLGVGRGGHRSQNNARRKPRLHLYEKPEGRVISQNLPIRQGNYQRKCWIKQRK